MTTREDPLQGKVRGGGGNRYSLDRETVQLKNDRATTEYCVLNIYHIQINLKDRVLLSRMYIDLL